MRSKLLGLAIALSMTGLAALAGYSVASAMLQGKTPCEVIPTNREVSDRAQQTPPAYGDHMGNVGGLPTDPAVTQDSGALRRQNLRDKSGRAWMDPPNVPFTFLDPGGNPITILIPDPNWPTPPEWGPPY